MILYCIFNKFGCNYLDWYLLSMELRTVESRYSCLLDMSSSSISFISEALKDPMGSSTIDDIIFNFILSVSVKLSGWLSSDSDKLMSPDSVVMTDIGVVWETSVLGVISVVMVLSVAVTVVLHSVVVAGRLLSFWWRQEGLVLFTNVMLPSSRLAWPK